MGNIEKVHNESLGITLRTHVTSTGDVVVSAEDLASALKYSQAQAMLKLLSDNHVKEVSRADLGLAPGRAIRYITEAGMNRAIMRSSLPEAERFQAWVEEEVLPAIRNEGGYVNDKATPEQIEKLQAQMERMQLRLNEAERDVEQTRNAAHNNQVRTDREVKLQLEEMRKRVDFWGNAYMRMREEAGRICRENGVSESRLPIV